MMQSMKRATDRAWVFLACFCLLASPRSLLCQAPAEPARSIADLVWIAGDWQTAPSPGRQVEEHWTKPAGGTMIGMGRTIAGGKTAEFEYLRLEQRADAIYYVAHPKARSPGT